MNGRSSVTSLAGVNLRGTADHNRRVTLHAIRVNGCLTRLDLASITGLTEPTIGNITKRLLRDGLIQETGFIRSKRGQPPTGLSINSQACYSVGLSIDRDYTSLVLIDFAGHIKARSSHEGKFASPGEVADFCRRSKARLIEQAGIDPKRIIGAGIAVPDHVADYLDVAGFAGLPSEYDRRGEAGLKAILSNALHVPVFVDSDVAAAVKGELQLGLGLVHSDFFYILISWKLGGGLVLDGTYSRGAHGRSGELGFLMHKDADGVAHQIRRKVSLFGMANSFERAGFAVGDMLKRGIPNPLIEPIADRWIEEAVNHLTAPLLAINCLINPAAILIGGRLPNNYIDRLADRARIVLGQRAGEGPVLAPIKRAMFADDAPAVGAAILPLSHYFLPRRNVLWSQHEPALPQVPETRAEQPPGMG